MIRTFRIWDTKPAHQPTLHEILRRRADELARRPEPIRRPVSRPSFAATA